MPVWPVWQLTSWVVDPHYLVRPQTVRQRAAEVSLVWRDDTNSVREVAPRLHEGAEIIQYASPSACGRGTRATSATSPTIQ